MPAQAALAARRYHAAGAAGDPGRPRMILCGAMQMSLGRAAGWLAEQDPERPSIVHEGRTITRRELEASSNRLARAYAELGVGEGDLVTIALANGIEFFQATLACWKLGAVPQPISSRLPPPERQALVELADPRLVVGAPAGEFERRRALPAGFEPDPALPEGPLPDRISPYWKAMATGGSTGRPKLIVEHKQGVCDPEAPVRGLGMRRDGAQLVAGPLYHQGPFVFSMYGLFSGNLLVVMTRFDASRALELIERHRVDWVFLVPTMSHRIWRLPREERESRDLSSLHRVMSTGSPWPVWLKRAFLEWLGPDRILEGYGGTEQQGGTMITGREALERPGSVGRITGGARLRILGPDGRELPPGEVGEIFLMPPGGPGSTYHYVGATPHARDGWESLGDMGWVDAEGYLYLADRCTDMVVTGGANVNPAEVEAALDSHPAVRSSAVIGLPDEDLGQRLHAIVDVTSPVEEEVLRAHVAAQLAGYKVPRSFEFAREPLRDDAGKLRRSALREARLRDR
jgi:bile acid-coenzyme A ligase